MTSAPSVLVVGAGPTGLAAALALAAGGAEVDVVERREAPSPLSRAVGIIPETLDKLDHAGVGQAIAAEAVRIDRVLIHRGGRRLLDVDFSGLGPGAGLNLGLPQNRTEELIRDGLARLGGDVRYGVSLEGLEQDGAGVTARFSDGTERRYGGLIGADGIGSTVRQALGVGFPGYDIQGEWSVADVDTAPGSLNVFSAWVQQEGGHFVFAIPIAPSRLRLACSAPDVIDRLPPEILIANVRRTGTFQIAIRQADAYAKGRVLLAGDAAHCHSPVGGRGMNLGVDDAAQAAAAILRDDAPGYAARQHGIGKRILNQSEQARRLVTATDPGRRAALWLACKALMASPWLQRRFLGVLTKL